MSHRNCPVSKDYTLIVDGKVTNIPDYDKDVIKELKWDEYLNNRKGPFYIEPERNVEYF